MTKPTSAKPRLAASPLVWGSDLRSWLDTADKALATGTVSAIFAPDHLWARDRSSTATLAWPVLLAAVQARHRATVGPLVARCGAGNDERIIHTLETLQDGGEVVANLGIGDRVGRKEHEAAGLPWPTREERICKMAETAARCLAAGLEVYVASDMDELHARMPTGAGAHISRARSELDHGSSIARPVSVAYWTETDRADFRHAASGRYDWVSIEQLRGETSTQFLNRIKEASEELEL